MPEVLVLQHAAEETAGTFGEVFAARGVAARVIRGFAGEPVPRSLEGAAGLLVLGGPMGVYEAERHPSLRDELRLIEHALAAGRPIVGIAVRDADHHAPSEVVRYRRVEPILWVGETRDVGDDLELNPPPLTATLHGDVHPKGRMDI